MIVFNFISGVNCRLRDLDVDSWRNHDETGVIPMNMGLEGILFVAISSFYILGRSMRVSFRPVGNILTLWQNDNVLPLGLNLAAKHRALLLAVPGQIAPH